MAASPEGVAATAFKQQLSLRDRNCIQTAAEPTRPALYITYANKYDAKTNLNIVCCTSILTPTI